MATSSSKERLKTALSHMEDHLKTIHLIRTTTTADELLTASVAAKLEGFTFNERQTDMLDNEILKRRRNEVPRDGSVADLALEQLSSSSPERSECLEDDRP